MLLGYWQSSFSYNLLRHRSFLNFNKRRTGLLPVGPILKCKRRHLEWGAFKRVQTNNVVGGVSFPWNMFQFRKIEDDDKFQNDADAVTVPCGVQNDL